jgi:hypothetical protein
MHACMQHAYMYAYVYVYVYVNIFMCIYIIYYIYRDVYIVLNRHLLGANTFCPTEYTGLTSSPAMRFGSWCACAGQPAKKGEGIAQDLWKLIMG